VDQNRIACHDYGQILPVVSNVGGVCGGARIRCPHYLVALFSSTLQAVERKRSCLDSLVVMADRVVQMSSSDVTTRNGAAPAAASATAVKRTESPPGSSAEAAVPAAAAETSSPSSQAESNEEASKQEDQVISQLERLPRLGRGHESTGASAARKTSAPTTAASEDACKTSSANGAGNNNEDDKGNEDDDVDEPLPLRGLNEVEGADQVEVTLSDDRALYTSAATFEELGLPVELLQGVYSMKFSKPSKVQAVSLPMILAAPPRNLIAQAHNGSGKTACFVLGMLSRVDTTKDVPQALCLVPTRELARQIRDVIMNLGKYTGCRVYLAVKQGEEERSQPRVTSIRDHIIVGTPGRVMDLLRHRVFSGKTIRILVLDEADEMIDTQGMGDQTLRIKKLLSPDVQTLLFSATYPDHVRDFALKVVPNANQITVKREQLSLDNVKQFYIDCGSSEGRFQVLSDIYGSLRIGQSIIFVERRRDASELARRMRADGHSVALLHGGDMTPEERDRVIDSFRAGTDRILISTSVLSRGVDVLATTVVMNYDLPRDRTGHADPETYLHRVGRTGRFGRKGIAINFIYDHWSRQLLQEIEQYYGDRCHIQAVANVEELVSILEDEANF